MSITVKSAATAGIPSPGALIEEGNPAEDPRLFRRCLGQYATGIAIITTAVDGERAGVTVNSFTSVSLDPPLVLWSISRASRSFRLFEKCGRFAVNLLGVDQTRIASHFASKSDDKFAEIRWHEGLSNVPLIEGCVVNLECECVARYDGGDHVILIGRAEHVRRYQCEPLLFVHGGYGIASSHPSISPTPGSEETPALDSFDNQIVPLIFEAHNVMSARFDEHRFAEGVTTAEARILAQVYLAPDTKLDTLATATYLGQREAEDALNELKTRSLLILEPDGRVRLSLGGKQLREAIRRRWHLFQEKQIEGIPDEDLRTAIRTLTKLIVRNR
ncbi:flavin reductase [Bradyrhizobium sp. RDI18]|uniref:flavin reductase n=1 Tax=Bradyrhizobium sp. RDI18 TaxID=3367400 RepID=UPI0037220589